MAEKIKLTISPAVAMYVRPGTSLETKLSGFTAAHDMATTDHLMLLFCLSKDADATVRSTALSAFSELPQEIVQEYLGCDAPHPLVLEALSVLRVNNPVEPGSDKDPSTSAVSDDISEPPESTPDVREDEPLDEDDEKYLSKFKQAQLLSIAEKIKMALSGDKEWRAILVKDSNKLVSGSVIKNPRISDGEILTLVKSGIQNDEIMRLICANKEWIKIYPIRKALIENNRTPIQNAIRYLGTMGEKDLAQFAKSKNISSVISTMAKRLLLNKKK